MKTKYTIATLGVAALLVGGAVWAAPLQGGTHHLYTVQGFVEMLIQKGIVPESMAEKARALAGMISRTEEVTPAVPQALNADKVTVSVSQLIQHSDRTYAPLADVEGLLLMVQNTTDADIILEAKRGCQVVYRIYSNDSLVFDSATTEKCTTDEEVTYQLAAHNSRMFEVKHAATDHSLEKGEYRFEIEYPGYGKGELLVTVADPS